MRTSTKMDALNVYDPFQTFGKCEQWHYEYYGQFQNDPIFSLHGTFKERWVSCFALTLVIP